MFRRATHRRSPKGQTSRLSRFGAGRRLQLEPLEDRRLLALVGVSPTFPTITYDALGPLNYNADSQVLSFQLDATPLQFRQSAATPNRAINAPRDFFISIHVDNNGQLIGGVDGPDLVVTGSLDIDGNGTVDYSGTLLTGEVAQFGFSDSGTTTDSFDFRFTPTGGPLAPLFAGRDIGVKTTSEASTFTGTFSSDFVGSTKGTLGSVSALWSSLSGYVYNDLGNDGLKQETDPGIAGVTLALTGADVGGNAVSATTTTDDNGAYSFAQLRPGTYTITETKPAGWLDGLDVQGTPGTGVDGDGVLSDIVLGAGVNGQNNNFGELAMSPSLTVLKLTNGVVAHGQTPGGDDPLLMVPAGSVVTWTYKLTNTGNTPLTNVSVSDNQGLVLSGPTGDTYDDGIFDPGEVWIYTATETAISGFYANIATVTATATDATGTVSVPVTGQDSNYYFGVVPGIAVTKLTNGEHNPNIAAGDDVTWTYTVTNTGNVNLSGVAVADEGATPVYQSGDDGDGVLNPGEVWTYTATGTAIVGAYTNTATATGTDQTGTVATPVSVTATDGYFGVQPGIAIVKLTNGTDNANPNVAAGDTVNWTYVVTNTGNVALTDVGVADDTSGVTPFYYSGDDGNGALDVGETWTYAAIGLAAVGQTANTGTAVGTDATGTVATPVSATEGDSYFGVQPGIAIVKLTNGTDNANAMLVPGASVTWTYQVTNTGNAALTGVAVADSDASVTPVLVGGDNGNGLLDAGETWVYQASGTAVAGQYANTGTATATDATGAVTTPVTASEGDGYFGVQPGVAIVKLTNGTDNNAAPGAQVVEGDAITWTYEVSNAGNVALTGVAVSDSDASVQPVYQGGDANADGMLDLGEVWVYTASGTAAAGQYSNTGTAIGQDATGTVVGTVTSSDIDYYYGATQQPATKSGYVYIDANNDGIKQDGEAGIKGVKIILTGTNDLGQSVCIVTTTNANGYYQFSSLRPGTYTVTEVQPTSSSSNGCGCGSYLFQWCEGGVWHFELHGSNGWLRECSDSANCALLDGLFAQLDDSDWSNDSFRWDDQDLCDALFRGTDYTKSCCSGSDDDFFRGHFSDFWDGVRTMCNRTTTTYLDGKDTAGSDGGTVGNDVISDIVLTWGENGVDNNFGELLPASITGNAYLDANNDGVRQSTEKAIPGVKVTLTGTDDLGNAVTATALTNRNGTYEFANLRPGTYTLTETQPSCYLDGKDAIGSSGGVAGNDVLGDIVLASGAKATANNFGELKPSSLSGFVYLDKNGNGDIDCRDLAIAGVTVTLTGVDDLGNAVSQTTVTDDDGAYAFSNLRPGDYAITEIQPDGYVDGADEIGSQGGVVGNDQFTAITLGQGVRGINNNFSEQPTANTVLHQGQTATIGFWNNNRGQALIKSLNGGQNATQLGNWLATMFPNMYGVKAGSHNLAGKTNAQVASFFKTLFNVHGMKIDAQAMAVALACYVTNSTLAGTVAASYGFVVNTIGTSAATFNIGSAGQAFNVANYTTLSILAILQRTNDQAKNGILWDINGNGSINCAEQVLRCMANDILTDINEIGDIG